MRSFHSEQFERLRQKAGLSHEQTAELLGVCVRTVFRYESGESRPSPVAVKWLQDHIDKQRKVPAATTSFRFIDLFAGIGGLRLAFEAIGGRCVFTSEWDRYCRKTYAANFNEPESEIGGDNAREKRARSFEQSGSRAPTKSQEARSWS
jgi:DNA (cytosine-5)-methyltransferase 1